MTEKKTFDVVVVGAGPGGYVAAIKAAQLGRSMALIEKGPLGGTCLNVGCIPTKTLLSNAAVLHQMKRAADFGISVGSVVVHYDQMKARKDRVIHTMRAGLDGLMKANKISVFRGTAQFESPRELKVMGEDNLYIGADRMILATGSVPLDMKAFPCDHKRILNSTSILELTSLPKSLAIVGGGYIGCEFASLFAELGSKVTILEAMPTILAAQGTAIAQFMTQALARRGIEIRTNVQVQAIDSQQGGAHISLHGGEALDAEFALVAVGRKIYTEGLHLEKAGLVLSQNGSLATNEKMETAVRGIYAIGDLTGKWMLAHLASHQGIVAAQNACGEEAAIHMEAVPAVVFTAPEIATVGLTLEAAQKQGFSVIEGTFPFRASGKAQAGLETEGFAQIVADKNTGQILGAAVVGHEASNLIAEMALAMQNELTLESVIQTIHAHPTMAEVWHEAALIASGTPIHLPPKAKR